MTAGLGFIGVGSAGCKLDANFDGTSYKCDVSGTCPSGFSCTSGTCVPESDGDGGVDAGPADVADYVPTPHCGGPSLLRDEFEGTTPEWGTPIESGGNVTFNDGLARVMLNPTTSDARVAFRTRQVYTLGGAAAGENGDGLEIEIASLSGPGAAGLAVRGSDGALELTVTETLLRCDRIVADGTVERASATRDGANQLRITARNARIYCEARATAADPWRAVGDYVGFGSGYVEAELFGIGLAGTGTTTVAFDNLNASRTAAGWCSPGSLLDDFSSMLTPIKWRLEMASCQSGATDGVTWLERQNGGTFKCHAAHRHLVDLSAAGRIGFEVQALIGAGAGVVGVGSPENGIAIAIVGAQISVERCVDGACAPVAQVPYTAAMRYVGFDARTSGVGAIWSSDQATWTAIGSSASPPFVRSAAPVFFGIRGSATMGTTRLSLERLFSTP